MSTSRPEIENVAAVTEQLAALLGAGVTPTNAWRYLGETPGASVLVRDVAQRVGAGASTEAAIAEAIDRPWSSAGGRRASRAFGRSGAQGAWAVLGASWAVATGAGAALGPCLAALAESFRDIGEVQRLVSTALAGPAATTRLVSAMPVLPIVGGALFGLDTWRILFTTAPGLACLVMGAALVGAGRVWAGRLIQRARVTDASAGLSLELVAVALSGGVAIPAARAAAAGVMQRFRIPADPGAASMEPVLQLAARAGAPAADLLRREARRLRRDLVAHSVDRATALGTWLMLPLGLCVLPAFLLLAVGPVLLAALEVTLTM